MLSRVADSLYWMSRNLERADNVARFVEVNLHLMLDLVLDNGRAQWMPLVQASGDNEAFTKRFGDASKDNVVYFLTFDLKNPNSIRSCIRNARENARTVREVIVSDLWETINRLYHLVESFSQNPDLDSLIPLYTEIKNASHLFIGIVENTMSHHEAWHFMRVGRMLERADKTARMLDVKYFILLPNSERVDSPHDLVEWGAVLKSVSGFEMYRKQYHRISYQNVSHFLIFEVAFPRPIKFCVDAANHSLNAITASLNIAVVAQDEMAILSKSLQSITIQDVLANGLHEFVDVFQFNLNVVDQAFYKSFNPTLG